MRFTIDASVHLNALHRSEVGSEASRQLLATLHQPVESSQYEIFVPTLLRVEVAASVARVLDDNEQALELAEAIWHLPHQFWIPLDDDLTREAQVLAANSRLRGADAVYAAVAQHFNAILITRDRQQLERVVEGSESTTPEEMLRRLNS